MVSNLKINSTIFIKETTRQFFFLMKFILILLVPKKYRKSSKIELHNHNEFTKSHIYLVFILKNYNK